MQHAARCGRAQHASVAGVDKPCAAAFASRTCPIGGMLVVVSVVGVEHRVCWLQLYPFDHVPARYIGVLAAGDAKLEVAEAGKAALRPPKPAAAGDRACTH